MNDKPDIFVGRPSVERSGNKVSSQTQKERKQKSLGWGGVSWLLCLERQKAGTNEQEKNKRAMVSCVGSV